MMVPPFYYERYIAPPKLLKAGVSREGKRKRRRGIPAHRCPGCLCNLSGMVCRNMMCEHYLQEMRKP